MHNAHARKVFVMHITDAYSDESKRSMVLNFTRHFCALVFIFKSVLVFIEKLFAEQGA